MPKVDALAEVLEVHPLTFLTLPDADLKHPKSADALINEVLKEVHVLMTQKKS
ncbi:MAG: XRE family transcriptional regulator [Polaromonas sp.]|nr:XRE family transcriptional regulator [Polaromonas sp.]